MGLLTTILAAAGFAIKGDLKFEAVDVNGRYWTGTFIDVQSYGVDTPTVERLMMNMFYESKGVKLRWLRVLSYTKK